MHANEPLLSPDPAATSLRSGTRSRRARFLGSLRDDLGFLLTNRIPRIAATRLMHRFSRIEAWPWPSLSIAVWSCFEKDLDLSEAQATEFKSLNDCFTRALKPNSRPIDPRDEVLTSPCDGIVGACGRVRGVEVLQAKGFPYSLRDLLGDDELVERHRDGLYVTIRLTGGMYHRFHAPCAGSAREVVYVSGDTWNVNPIALQRIERLFCKNERAIFPIDTGRPGLVLTLVPVAAVLVASMRIHGLPAPLDLRYRGPNRIACDLRFEKGDELGWFEQGSTILVFASGPVELVPGLVQGARLRMGTPLLLHRGTGSTKT